MLISSRPGAALRRGGVGTRLQVVLKPFCGIKRRNGSFCKRESAGGKVESWKTKLIKHLKPLVCARKRENSSEFQKIGLFEIKN